jgi:hypothetical protein
VYSYPQIYSKFSTKNSQEFLNVPTHINLNCVAFSSITGYLKSNGMYLCKTNMRVKPRNHDKPINQTTINEVAKLAKQGYSATQIANRLGRTPNSIYNILRQHRIDLSKKNR